MTLDKEYIYLCGRKYVTRVQIAFPECSFPFKRCKYLQKELSKDFIFSVHSVWTEGTVVNILVLDNYTSEELITSGQQH